MSHPFEREADPTSHWRSLAERDGVEAYLKRLETEFMGDPTLAPNDLSRRRFLQVMGASIALAGVAGCQWPEEEIVPFGKRPEGYRPGRISRFATTLDLGGRTRPVLVSSYDGRPIKIEGNPDHPMSLGATDAWAQASVLDVYDPDRSGGARAFARGIEVTATRDEVDEFLRRQRESLGDGAGFAVFSAASSSPSLAALRVRLLARAPRARWYESSTFSRHNEAEALDRLAVGSGYGRTDLSEARVIVDFGADLLATHPNGIRNARDYAAGRDPHHGAMNRLYAFEASLSVTGSSADHRVPISSGLVPAALVVLAGQVADHDGAAALGGFGFLDGDVRAARAALSTDVHGGRLLQVLEAAASDLAANPGHAIVALSESQPSEAHALVWALNAALGGVGHTVHFQARDMSGIFGGLNELTAALDSGEVETLLVLDANPIYDAPAGLDFDAAFARATQRIHVGTHVNETAAASTWHLPAAHPLERWGDALAEDGSVCAVQPLIRSLFGGFSPLELLSRLVDEKPRSAHAIVRDTFHAIGGGSGSAPEIDPGFESAWKRYLHDGFLAGAASSAGPARTDRETGERLMESIRGFTSPTAASVEVVVDIDSKVLDGRFANNAWMQELPDPITKLTWDNVATVSVAMAEELDIEDGQIVRLTVEDRSIELPALVQPGQARYSVSVAAGYGRSRAGRVGTGVGVRVFDLLDGTDAGSVRASITPTGSRVTLACTQDHYLIDPRGRDERERRVGALAREGTLDEYREHPEFAHHRGLHHPPLESLWDEREWAEGPQWGMAIDLNLCTGCSACVTACQAENNISVVGREQVINGREMHWLRIDRYFQGDPDEPAVIQQPVGCAQCELAPCEGVCPVGATMHSSEGLNVMAYNRCVGTRYCSNNCPYKVRRFNFFNYHKDLTEVEELAFNPEVTVRARGVMEKCTYCVQRIEHARIEAKNQRRAMRDGDVVTACQQTCPTQAIRFGDLRDPGSAISQAHQDHRAYALLGELNLKPRTLFLAKLRNPHPALANGDSHHGDTGRENAAEHG